MTIHADEMDAVEQLVGRTLSRADADLLGDLDAALREARSLIDLFWADTKVWRYLQRKGYADLLELWTERESTHTELCWMWEEDK